MLELLFVIYKVCKFGCVANKIPRHLKQKHIKIIANQIDEIIKVVDAIPGLVCRQDELYDF
jgi:hypothetical protein